MAGLSPTYAAQTDLIALNGTAPVSLPRQYLRINSMLIADAGSGETNAGVVTLTRADAVVQAIISAGTGITQQSIYTVPNGFTLLLVSIDVEINSGAGARSADVVTMVRGLNATSGNRFFRMPRRLTVTENAPVILQPRTFIPVAGKTDFSLRIITSTVNNLPVTAAWEGVLFDNAVL